MLIFVSVVRIITTLKKPAGHFVVRIITILILIIIIHLMKRYLIKTCINFPYV